ncbi:uncharacterized protein [Nicotiana tomentosiformis]|uniref:uncharacterized protein n=1 Tax=Nicotiana tomentosiformis TaxID=4098 RepID=UPI00388C5506
MNGFVLAKKILRAGYFWMTMETDCIRSRQQEHQEDIEEDVIPAEVEIPSLRIIQEAELSDAEWLQSRYEQLALTDGTIMSAVCHDQLYQNRMARAFNKRVRPRQFTQGQLVLKRILSHQDEAKGKFSPNWQGPYMVHRVLTGGALILVEMNGEIWPKPINSDAVKRYYV